MGQETNPQSTVQSSAGGGSPGNVFVGTSGWAYPTWKPEFYPQATPQKKFLEYYATQLNSVEVNYTFRQLPTPSMLAGWMAATGAGFRFSFKAPQRITHIRRLKECGEDVAFLARALEPVAAAGKMGIVLFQLPPNFKADAGRLGTFLEEAGPAGLRVAFEFRHESWFSEETYAVLNKHGAALCVAESEDLETPDVETASFACYRLRMSGGYSEEQLEEIARKLRQRSVEKEVFAYFKHEDEPTGALCAVATTRALRAR
ncbi:DUF72 domain-containing protein [Acidobacteria bacterium AB60]|nr:DUF72 domain-containing protein [Acidobacteria bacterium AB60]